VSALGRLKDIALEKGLAHFLRPKLARYGELKSLNVNTAKKSVSAEIQLLGEETPLVISNAHYRLEPEGERLFVAIHDVIVSRPWLQNVIDDHFDELRLEIPSSLRTMVKHLL